MISTHDLLLTSERMRRVSRERYRDEKRPLVINPADLCAGLEYYARLVVSDLASKRFAGDYRVLVASTEETRPRLVLPSLRSCVEVSLLTFPEASEVPEGPAIRRWVDADSSTIYRPSLFRLPIEEGYFIRPDFRRDPPQAGETVPDPVGPLAYA